MVEDPAYTGLLGVHSKHTKEHRVVVFSLARRHRGVLPCCHPLSSTYPASQTSPVLETCGGKFGTLPRPPAYLNIPNARMRVPCWDVARSPSPFISSSQLSIHQPLCILQKCAGRFSMFFGRPQPYPHINVCVRTCFVCPQVPTVYVGNGDDECSCLTVPEYAMTFGGGFYSFTANGVRGPINVPPPSHCPRA